MKQMSAARTGFHDWYWQRVSAALLLLLLPTLIGSLLAIYSGNLDFNTLSHWFTHPLGKLASTLLLLTMTLHIWTGLKVIIEDYVHTTSGRMLVLNLLLVALFLGSFYMLYHIWAEVSYSLACTPCSKGER